MFDIANPYWSPVVSAAAVVFSSSHVVGGVMPAASKIALL